MKLLFIGDINFRGQNILSYEKSKRLLEKVQPYLDMADFRISNLECVLVDGKNSKYSPIKKSGPHHAYAPENICFLKALQADVVTLANNHIGDYGEAALEDTIKLLHENKFLTVGAGRNIREAYNCCIPRRKRVLPGSVTRYCRALQIYM
ncbi:MAG: CapA family protein [Bacillota bacterium]|jgi:poly-gamma-glutamate capsule biosynthesis protein CapA/YwtB (metallophosphatase superfamily)